MSWICTIINVFLLVPIYLLSGVIFASKIAFLPKVVSFGYDINLETLIFLYLPFMIIVNIFATLVVPFSNIVFVALCLSTLYIRPLILYRQNKIALLGAGLIIGLLTVSAILKILEIQTIHKPNYFLIIFGSLMVSWIVVKFAQKRMSSILLNKP